MRSLSELFTDFFQLGYVTDDIDKAADHVESTYGTAECIRHYRGSVGGPDASNGPGPASFVAADGVLTDGYVIDAALVNIGRTNIEIIRPVSGAVDIYRDAIRLGSPMTLHHIGFRIDDFDEASRVVADSGRRWALHGDSGGIRFGYLDMTAELGHYLEVVELDESAAADFTHFIGHNTPK